MSEGAANGALFVGLCALIALLTRHVYADEALIACLAAYATGWAASFFPRLWVVFAFLCVLASAFALSFTLYGVL